MDEFLDGTNLLIDRGITRIDGVQGKKQASAPMFEPEVYRKQMCCIEEGACDIVVTFWRLHNHSAPRAVFQRPQSDSASVELRPPCPLRYVPAD